ncbi:MAG TPA: TonB family protein [Terriglobales bacterium]|jgi:TonB family protein
MQAVANASRLADFAAQWQGQVVDGRFPLEQYLGGSEQQAVFLTRVPGGATKAAIKLIRATACNPDAQVAAWRRAAKLSHPHLIRIFDGGRCWLASADLVFVVTEYAEENLAQVVPQRALTASETDAMLVPTAEALAYLHNQGLVHGRIRPSNVMAVNDQLKLSSDGVQEPGAPVRKPQPAVYDAPEAATGRLSAASDIWSLGATVAESLTQRVPRKYENSLKLEQPFADVVSHALIEDPAARWTVSDIQARLAGKKVASQKSSTVAKPAVPIAAVPAAKVQSHAQPREKKSPLPFIVAAVVVVAIIAVAYFLVRGNSTQSADRSANTQTSAPADSAQPASTAGPNSPPARPNTSGQVVNRVLPTPSRSALNTIHGTIKVRVKVKVDAAGNVTHAGFVTSGPSQYFARLAMQAAQQWKFVPGAAATEPTLLFEYNRRGVDASVQSR